MSKVIQIEVERVRTNGGTQVRAEHDRDAINEYAMVTDQLPPIVVFHDGKEFWLADGFQRILANVEAGNATIQAEVLSGTQRDALLYALKANADGRGVRLNHKDRKKGREILLKDAEWSQWSDRELARRFPHLGTDKTFASVRVELAALAEPCEEEKDERARCAKCGQRYAIASVGRDCDNEKCGGKIKTAESTQFAVKSAVKKTSKVGGRGIKKRKTVAAAPSKKLVEADAAAFREEQLVCLADELGPWVERYIPRTDKLKLKRTHGMMERMKMAIEADKRRLLA